MKDRADPNARNHKYDAYQKGLASMVCKIFETRTGLGVSVIEYLAENLHKPAIKTFKRINVYARFKGNIWEADLAEMGSLLNVKQLLCVTKYA